MAVPALVVKARMLNDPPLWCWEIVDDATGEVAESSWHRYWVAYGSADEALRRGRLELIRLASRRPGALAAARRSPTSPVPLPVRSSA
jgi:hypothetical protein